MLTKRILSLLLSTLIVAIAMIAPIWAKEDSAQNSSSKSVMISMYDDIGNKYIIENTKVPLESAVTAFKVLEYLKEQEIIFDFITIGYNLETLVALDETKYEATMGTDSTLFYMKVNGKLRSGNVILKNGDIVEWIYCSKDAYPTQAPISQESGSEDEDYTASVSTWDSEDDKRISDAATWLERNRDSSSSYLAAMGIANKPANSKLVNKLQADIQSENEYSTPTTLAKNIISASFCGFDASSKKYGALIEKLANYENITSVGIFGAVNAITAYDSNSYEVSENAVNSRKALVDSILSFQNDDGGFPVFTGTASDIDTTAMVITAISSYRERQDVCDAIDKAILYLEAQQTETGGYGYKGKETCESLATVIIALNSIGISVSDERFIAANGKNLYELLKEYQNADGGFAHTLGDASNAMATEQAIIASIAQKKSRNPYKLLKLVPKYDDSADEAQGMAAQKSQIWEITTFVLCGVVVVLVSIMIWHGVKKSREKKSKSE